MLKYKWPIIIALIVIAGLLSFFCSFYKNDVKALEDFSASYERFDEAVSNYSTADTDDLESKADNALIELVKASSFRISSLIKNDSELMKNAVEISDFSRKEMEHLKSYKSAILNKNADFDRLFQEYSDVSTKRKTAYAHFLELSESKQ